MSVLIERLGHLGDGLAAGGLRVARALPGETIDGTVVAGRIATPEILVASPDRVEAACPQYDSCGGCALMHASDRFVAEWKTDIVRSALAAHGMTAPIKGIATSPARSRRRAVLSARRSKTGVLLGFHGRRSDQLADMQACHVLVPEIVAALDDLRALVAVGGSRKGEMALTVTASGSGLDVVASSGKAMSPDLNQRLVEIASRAGWARLVWADEVVLVRTPPAQTFGSAKVVPPPGAFLQATRHGEAALVASVKAAIGPSVHVVDLFAGCGTFALPLAKTAAIHAVEGEPTMVDALMAGWRGATGLKPVTSEARDLFRRPLLAEELDRFEAVVIDPPRAGAEAQMTEIARSDVPLVASVSCNPVTFARDAKLLTEAGFHLNWVRIVDQFRWSAHVELAAQFARGHIAGNETD